jgi:CHAD domain-containing protein
MAPDRRQLERAARRAAEEATRHPRAIAMAAVGTGAAAAAGIRQRMGASNGELGDETAYRLLDGETVSSGIKRLVLARVDDALAELGGETESSRAEAIHQARKDLKKIRSAMRLVREPLGDEVYRFENGHYRDIGRTLGGFRDAEVLIETLDDLEERFGPAAGERSAGLRVHLESERQGLEEGGAQERAIASARGALEEGRGRVISWPLHGDGWQLIGPGLERTYRRGRKRLRAVEANATVTNLHEWRKRVKDLWYQLRLIRRAEPELFGHLVRDADDLADHLGVDHDLALLREAATDRSDDFSSAADQRHLMELIDRRRGELHFAATTLGTRVYREKPKKFIKRLERRWR